MAANELEALRKQLEAIQRSHDTLLRSLAAAHNPFGQPEAASFPRPTIKHGRDAVFADTFTLSDDSSDDENDFFVQEELPSQTFDHEHLREHLKTHNWTDHGREILASIVCDPGKLSKQPHLFHLGPGPAEDRSHYSHFQVYNVGSDGVPEFIEVSGAENGMSKATEIWHALRDISQTTDQTIAGRITIAREPSPILFAALHLTLHSVFDMDEIFRHLVQTEASSAHMFRAFDEQLKHQRTFFFSFEYYTIIGDECEPMQWQVGKKMSRHMDGLIPLSRCGAVVALALFDKNPRRIRNRDRRAKTKYGWVHDIWSPWQVLQLESFPDWKSTPSNGEPYTFEAGYRYMNGAEAFLHALLAEYRDARKRYDEVYKQISELITPPLGFLFNEDLRQKRLFEDKDFTWTRRYFYAHQVLGNVNDSIKSMVDAFEDTFSAEVWEGQSKILWPLTEESPRNSHWKRRLRSLRLQFEHEMKELRIIQTENNERRHEIETLQGQLFSGTSIQEARKSVELADVTVHQGYNIKILTIVNLFFMPLTFVTSVFGMTNMPAGPAPFWPFGVVLVAVCIPFFSIIGFLSTNFGYRIWMTKTRQFWRWLRPKRDPKSINEIKEMKPVRANRTMSTHEGMRLRLNNGHKPPSRHASYRGSNNHRASISHPNTQRTAEKMGEGQTSGLAQTGILKIDRGMKQDQTNRKGSMSNTVIDIKES